jgi:hypothetical protein
MGKPTKNCRNVTKEIPHFPGEDDSTPVRKKDNEGIYTKYRTTARELWIELDEVFQAAYDAHPIIFEKYFQGFEAENIKPHPLAAHFLTNLRRKKDGS